MFPLAIPLAGILGSILTSVVGAVISSETSKDMMREQASVNQQGIDTANRYNLPINQMQRLRDAGLNPNLVYGNGSVAGLTSSGQASTNQGYKQVPFSLGVSQALDQFMQSKQINQSIEESKSRQLLLAQQVRESLSREEKNEMELAFDRRTFEHRVHQNERLNTVIEKQLDLMGSQADMFSSQAMVNREKIAEVQANVDLIAQREHLTREQVLTEGMKRQSMYSNMILNGAVIEKIAHEIAYIDAGTSLRELAYKMQNVNFEGTKMGDEWLSKHPTIATIENLIRRVLSDVGQIFGSSVSYKF